MLLQQIFELRDRIAEALLADGFLYTYDLSLKHNDFYSVVPYTREHLKNVPGVLRVNGFGHLGMTINHKQICASLPLRFQYSAKLSQKTVFPKGFFCVGV